MRKLLTFLVPALLAVLSVSACQGQQRSLNIVPGPGPNGTVNIDVSALGSYPKTLTRQRVAIQISRLGKIDVFGIRQAKDMENGKVAFNVKLPTGRYQVAVAMRNYVSKGNAPHPVLGAERFTVDEGGAIRNISVIPEEGEQ